MNNRNCFNPAFSRPADAVAFIHGSENYPGISGTVRFYRTPDAVLVRAEISGLPTGEGGCDSPIFAFHIHGGTECAGDEKDSFADAKGHFNPDDCQHPYHAGDMPPLFGVNGRACLTFLTDRFTVREILGKTVIIHRMPDDFKTQPSGNAGEKIACGVIMQTRR
ncbi:MAG: superoxide dismutase family protein [Acutalibacteraceae bacterium]